MKDSWAIKYTDFSVYFTLLDMKPYQVSAGKSYVSDYLNVVSDEGVHGEMTRLEVFERRARAILPTEVL